jgi:Tol biopolymer transport system component
MVHVYRAAVYALVIVAALLVYLVLNKFFGKRSRAVPAALALLTLGALLWCTFEALSRPPLLRKYAPLLVVKGQKGQKGKKGGKAGMLYMQTEVRICDPDGSNDEPFLPEDFITTRDITWSPDGTRMACSRVRDHEEGMHIFVYDADGDNAVQLTSGPDIARRPSWSPDGTKIVYDFRPSKRQPHTDLFVVDVDGTEREKLELGAQVHAYHPAWAPDGTIYCCIKENRRDDVWALDADGSNLRRITATPDQSETELAVSPDGGTIAVSVNRRELYVLDADGGNFRAVLDADGKPCRGRDPSWSPDGKRLLFAGFAADKSRRYIKEIPVDGGESRRIEVSDGKLLNPVLSPRNPGCSTCGLSKP